jgi:hypothetical protein
MIDDLWDYNLKCFCPRVEVRDRFRLDEKEQFIWRDKLGSCLG